MHDHDLDLIAALADGTLDDQTEARARVESCEVCRVEFEAQVSILAALATIEPVRMTELEKAALHRDLWTELRSEPANQASTSPWWYRLSYAAAGLFVVVGLVAVANQMGGSEDTGGQVETFTQASGRLDAGSEEDAEAPMYEYGAQSTETTTPAGDASAETTPDFETLATQARLREFPAADSALPTEDQADCLDAAGLVDQELVGTVDRERTYLIAVPAGVDLDADTPVSFVDADTCEVVHVED
ncbi:MAG TPA: hypothetical protein VJA46_03115 [Acidimicrobiia bacterium]|nr:hypothetical protein [Acidimicrobiia bacterium]